MPDQILRKTIVRNKINKAPVLTFDLPPDRLIDREYCKVTYEDVFKSRTWEKLIASENIKMIIPETIGLYMFIWKPYFKLKDENNDFDLRYVLYVGKSESGESTLRKRFANDYAKYIKSNPEILWKNNPLKNRSDRIEKYLNLWELEYWFCTFNKTEEGLISAFEQKLIELFNPPINDKHTRRMKLKPGAITKPF